jgi:hypothetical protein
MHIRAKHYLTALSVMAFFALPVWAHTDSAELTVLNPTMIAGQQLKPGTYKLEVQPSQTQMKVVNAQTYKTVAEVPVHWIQIKKAPNSTEVILNKNNVNEVEFGGKTQAVRVG